MGIFDKKQKNIEPEKSKEKLIKSIKLEKAGFEVEVIDGEKFVLYFWNHHTYEINLRGSFEELASQLRVARILLEEASETYKVQFPDKKE